MSVVSREGYTHPKECARQSTEVQEENIFVPVINKIKMEVLKVIFISSFSHSFSLPFFVGFIM